MIEISNIQRHRKTLYLKIVLFSAAVCFLLFLFVISAPFDFPLNKIITIEKGATLKETAQKFEKENIIRYSVLFDSLLRYSGYEKEVKAGKYLFKNRLSIFGVMKRIIEGDYGILNIKITIPEGATIKDINMIFAEAGFENFNIQEAGIEGYLFPDTYFFAIDTLPKDAVAKMTENLKAKITPDLEKAILEHKRTFHQILTMASLLEKEAAKTEERKMISGILWKRIDTKMLLQVDAVFRYILGKNTFELTTEDLKIDSPYNTYRYKGLPPTPIANPGLDAIVAAIFPEKSPYWYYLSDKEGNIYYAKTFDEHKANKAKYLR